MFQPIRVPRSCTRDEGRALEAALQEQASNHLKSALYRVFHILNRSLVRWMMRKYKSFRFHQREATQWLRGIAKRQPELFAHWQMGIRP